MYNKALEVLNIFKKNGYVAYIIGGYPRDYLLGIKTTDIDICTNATPKQIMEIFNTESVNELNYGSVVVIYKRALFDVTTFRKDIKYEDNRKPIKIKYINDLKTDILRRDFTINTICIDSDGNFIDLLNAKQDLDKHLIKTVGNPRYKLKEDSLRILRAIRFSAILGFDIDAKTKYYLKRYSYLLRKLSGSRKKEELDKILMSKNKEKARNLMIELGIDKHLGLTNLKDIVLCNDIIGIWSQLNDVPDIPFSKLEKDSINKIRELLNSDINELTIYKAGLYISGVAASIKGISYNKINKIYHNLPIYSRKDIAINGMDIANVLNLSPGIYIKEIMTDIEKKILTSKLDNDKEELLKYIKKNY